ncbi:5-(hydroxymethyl)furfural/furfural oxidase [Bradyrhizobium sp. Rc3b]|uniref:GMC family oxidoreductase n=1 Tax=Bradyrhizobium sp. Rc3b TaxID=1855322 RepID=UPI0008E905FA|nr:GMC family oxidoreductase N-terminal domain-containing protein [Bradyrhizobium sp. Rc3b]SFM49785.1 5-(hydroxymethyl)furfural/furfural oxidase [Bradyrhizobium sp. Rc3b]
MIADYVIVGGGSAGAVLASRLSENSANRVVLLEAGADTPPDATPADIDDTFPSSSLNPEYFWPELQARRREGGRLHPYPQARIMGGGSSIMGMWALRGMPSDYRRWSEAGAEGWDWPDVVPYFHRAEAHADEPSSGGPYPIRIPPRAEWPGFVRAIEAAMQTRGFGHIEDINETPGCGFFAMPNAATAHKRSSTASRYLTAAVRARSNLTILAGATVRALRIENGRATGVSVERAGGSRELAAGEVILSAGAIHSPALLMRAGIGNAESLRDVGIEPRLHRPGVGQNLQNHPYLHIAMTLPARARLPAALRRFALAGVRHSSGLADCPAGDLVLTAIGRVSSHSFGVDLAMFSAALYAPYSQGTVVLTNAAPEAPPAIDFRFLDDPRDAPRILQAARFAESLLADPLFGRHYHDAFLLPPVMSLDQFGKTGLAGALTALGASLVLNAPPPISRLILSRRLAPGFWIANRRHQRVLNDDEILSAIAPMGHVSGTCRMGRAEDANAVVDAHCRVIGLGGLRVVDASVMPCVPSANTNLPTIMVAEKAADLIRRDCVR